MDFYSENVFDKEFNIKHEPEAEYLLLLPRADADNEKSSSMPEPMKEELFIRECVVNVMRIPENYEHYNEKRHHVKEVKSKQIKKSLYKCELCKSLYGHLNTYEVHQCFVRPAQWPERRYMCEYCSKKFRYRENLVQHISIHLDELKDNCEICGKRMVANRLRQHILYAHKAKPIYNCDLCGIRKKTLLNMEGHMLSHSKPYECKICKRRFSEIRYFEEHKLNHKEPNPFKCKKCKKGYTRKTSLIRHMHTAHSKKRNFKCTECDYRGKTKDDLTTHMKSHTKAFQCDVCDKKFSRSSLLKYHRVLHDNPNAYQCKICLLRLTEKKNLRNHLRKKHEK